MNQKFFYSGYHQPDGSRSNRAGKILKGWTGWLEDFASNLSVTKQRMHDAEPGVVTFNRIKSHLTK